MWKRVSGFPWWARVVVGLVCLLLALKLTVWLLVERITDAAAQHVDVQYDGSFFDWRGHFGTRDVVIASYDEQGTPAGEFAMDRLVVRPSSQLWLLRNAFFSGSKFAPDRIGLTLENFRSVGDGETTPGNYTNLPYDAMGCAPSLLTPRDLLGMGLDVPKRNIHLDLDRTSSRSVDLTFTMESPGLGSFSVLANVDVEWPVRMKTLFDELEQAPLRSVTVTARDLGFIAARNRACAERHGMSAAEFQTHHMQEVRSWMGQQAFGYGDAALEQYAHFAAHGGELVIRSVGRREITLGQFLEMDQLQKFRAFDLRVAAADRPAVDMAVFRTAQAGTPRQPSASAGVASAPASLQPASGAPRPEPGSRVGYEQASALVGEHVDIRTRHNTERAGTLLVHSPTMITMKLDPSSGGFNLTLYRQEIADIRYTPPQAAHAAVGTH
jgi:hypothetical protein